METNNNNFGKWLENVLKGRGMSQAELARRTNVSRSAINGVINGTRNPGRNMLVSLANALTLPLQDLFQAGGGGVDYNYDNSTDFAEWIQIYEDADVDMKKELLGIAQFWIESNKRKSRR